MVCTFFKVEFEGQLWRRGEGEGDRLEVKGEVAERETSLAAAFHAY